MHLFKVVVLGLFITSTPFLYTSEPPRTVPGDEPIEIDLVLHGSAGKRSGVCDSYSNSSSQDSSAVVAHLQHHLYKYEGRSDGKSCLGICVCCSCIGALCLIYLIFSK